MPSDTVFAQIGMEQFLDLHHFTKKDKANRYGCLLAIALNQYLKWRENPQNRSDSFVLSESPVTLTLAFGDVSQEISDKLREITHREKLSRDRLFQHAVHLYLEKRRASGTTCPHCGSKDYEVKNHDEFWHDGDIYCKACGTFIRDFDAG